MLSREGEEPRQLQLIIVVVVGGGVGGDVRLLTAAVGLDAVAVVRRVVASWLVAVSGAIVVGDDREAFKVAV
jgi:hypothetical protein